MVNVDQGVLRFRGESAKNERPASTLDDGSTTSFVKHYACLESRIKILLYFMSKKPARQS